MLEPVMRGRSDKEVAMDVAMIGAGNVGSALAASLIRAGHSVVITATSREKAERVAQETGARAGGSNREAAEASEVVILAVPADVIDEVVEEMEGALDGKVVVDPTNRVDPNDPGSVLDGTSVAERIKRPASRVPTSPRRSTPSSAGTCQTPRWTGCRWTPSWPAMTAPGRR
jgi:8-hydroxy-5-deazaflavin:NADPH oxidoreductase